MNASSLTSFSKDLSGVGERRLEEPLREAHHDDHLVAFHEFLTILGNDETIVEVYRSIVAEGPDSGIKGIQYAVPYLNIVYRIAKFYIRGILVRVDDQLIVFDKNAIRIERYAPCGVRVFVDEGVEVSRIKHVGDASVLGRRLTSIVEAVVEAVEVVVALDEST